MPYELIVRAVGQPPRRVAVPAAGLTIGRVPGNDLVLPDVTTSRHHARLVFRDGVLHLEDAGSTSGIFMNGARWADGPIAAGAIFRLGKNELEIILTSGTAVS